MILVQIECTKNGVLKSFEFSGHAGYAEPGFDIVCSAVTVLVKTSLQVLSNKQELVLETCVKKGFISCSVKNQVIDQNLGSILSYTADFLKTGLSGIKKSYPENISLKVKIDS